MSNRVKCWLCNQWNAEKHIRKESFMGKLEQVCIKCYTELRARDAMLDDVALEEEYAKDNTGPNPGEYNPRTGRIRENTEEPKKPKSKRKKRVPKSKSLDTEAH